MATTLTVDAVEQSTYVVKITFYDEDGALVTPTAATWTLTDPAGNVVNERADIEISGLTSSVDVLLTGDDLALEGYDTYTRHFTLEATYNSTLGSDLPLKAVAIFEIEPLVAV